jgi:hypothetical protein
MSVTAHSDWGSASDTIRRQLDKRCKEPRVLHFYQNPFYEMTYNNSALGFSQSQITMLRKMPTVEEIRSFCPVKLLLAPSGCKAIPEGVEHPNDLLHHGWRLISVGKIVRPMIHMFPHGIRGWRLQYSFHHRIAATVHAVMEMSVSTTDSRYRLWEKEQAVELLLYRTFTARDLIFVGDKVDTIDALASHFQMRSQYTEYISHLLQMLCGTLVGGSSLIAPVIQNELILF